jgi:hypothetical protein
LATEAPSQRRTPDRVAAAVRYNPV